MSTNLIDYAKSLLRPYVFRGDTVSELAKSCLGWGTREFSVQIGGYMWIGDNTIQLGNYDVGVVICQTQEAQKFSLKALYEELLQEKTHPPLEQLALF